MKITTHSGMYHADDVFAVAILKFIHPEAEIIRTRNKDLFEKSDIVVDVGGIYDDEKKRYDHHQQGFEEKRESGLPYSACGLVWKHYGLKLYSEEIVKKVDSKLFVAIDAIDNGINYGRNKFEQLPYTVSNVVESLGPTFLEEGDIDKAFLEAVSLAQIIIKREVEIARAGIKAKEIVRKALEEYKDEKYIILDVYCPWKSTVIEESDKLLVLIGRDDGSWIISTVPEEKGSFTPRMKLPEAWAGLTGEELEKESGVKDAVFCHKARFIATALNKDAALKMMELALKEQK